jgi:hypothetical protein
MEINLKKKTIYKAVLILMLLIVILKYKTHLIDFFCSFFEELNQN